MPHNPPEMKTQAYRALVENARGIVTRAIRTGKLVKQPCARCSARKVQAHHPDYTKPLEWPVPRGLCLHKKHK